MGDLKLYGSEGNWKLYDVVDDVGEEHDLAKEPEHAQQLAKMKSPSSPLLAWPRLAWLTRPASAGHPYGVRWLTARA